jgi:hypothetical protein
MPVVVGGGKPFLPARKKLRLRLAEHRAFASGTVYLRYERVTLRPLLYPTVDSPRLAIFQQPRPGSGNKDAPVFTGLY